MFPSRRPDTHAASAEEREREARQVMERLGRLASGPRA